MSKIKFIISSSILVFTTLACSALAPTAKQPTPTMVVIAEPTQQRPSITIVPTQEQPQSNIPQTADQVGRVGLAEAKMAFDNNSAIFVDTRSKQAYEASHIKGALYIGDFELSSVSLDKHQWIITYCT